MAVVTGCHKYKWATSHYIRKHFMKCIKILRCDKAPSTNAALANRMCMLSLCLAVHCTIQCRDVNHNLLRAVGHECAVSRCTKTCHARCQFSTCDLQRDLQEECVYWQELRQKASEKLQKWNLELLGAVFKKVSWHLQYCNDHLWV